MPRKSRIVLGLNSGTSADGVDAVACEIRGNGLDMKVKVLGYIHRPYSRKLRDRILAVMAPAKTSTQEICRLETELGRAFADAAESAVKALRLKRLDLVGSHGQTICHLPPQSTRSKDAPGTLQIADPAIIASRLRCPVVHHFRQADLAVGGQGAPLVPWTDYVLFRHPRKSRIIQNIGGIANLTYLPAGGPPESVAAFDTGPGNMLIDACVRHFTNGREQFDRGGRRAARGRAHAAIVSQVMKHRFFTRPPPKSCGREEFGDGFFQKLLRRFGTRGLSPDDWIATMTEITALSISLAWFLVGLFGEPSARLRLEAPTSLTPAVEVLLCGGGTKNAALVEALRRHNSGCSTAALGCVSCGSPVRDRAIKITTMDECGISSQAKEGVSFAMLAAACIDGVPANLPKVTGASRKVVLGQICDPEPRT